MFRAGFRDLPDSCGNTTALIRNVYDGRATDSEAGKPVRRLSEHDARRGDFIPSSVVAPSSRCLERKTDGILSLASGTFVLLVRLFFFVLAAEVPPVGLRKENGKLKINYTFANGETSDVEVREEIGNLILDSRREESNQDRKERYHCYSLDAAEYEGEDYADGSTPETELFLQVENQRIKKAFEQLSEVQRRRLLMLAEGVSLREIARREGKDIKSIRESIEGARKKFLKYF